MSSNLVTPNGYDKEEILKIPTPSGSLSCLIISGYAHFIFGEKYGGPIGAKLSGNPDSDDTWDSFTVHLWVGPEWENARDVSPIVTVGGWSFVAPDTTDNAGCHIDSCTYEIIDVDQGNIQKEKIRLIVKMRIRGGTNYTVTKLAYQVAVTGKNPKFS